MLTALLEEGHTIERVGFIQEGKCSAYAKVPNTPRPVQVSNTASCCMITGKGRIERKDQGGMVALTTYITILQVRYVHCELYCRCALVSLVLAVVLGSYFWGERRLNHTPLCPLPGWGSDGSLVQSSEVSLISNLLGQTLTYWPWNYRSTQARELRPPRWTKVEHGS